MSKLKEINKHASTEWWNAIYEDDTEQEFEIVFTRSYEDNIGYESRELVNVEKEGTTIDTKEPIWTEINEAVSETELKPPLDYKNLQFTINIDRNWIETLEQLIEAILSDSQSSPEGALEAAIFSQIKQQLS